MKEKYLLRVLSLYSIVFAVCHLAAALTPESSNWGFHHWGFFGTGWQVAIPLLMLCFAIPVVHKVLFILIDRLTEAWRSLPKRIPLLIVFLFVVIAGVVFWMFRQRTYFLGDGYLLLRNLDGMASLNQVAVIFKDEPLDGLKVWYLRNILSAAGDGSSVLHAFQLLSVLCGAGAAVVSVLIARSLAAGAIERSLTAIFILAAAGSQLFFGYVETYVLSALLFLLFFYASVEYVMQRMSIIIPLTLFGILCASYFGMLAFAPGALLLGVLALRRKEYAGVVIGSIAMAGSFAGILAYCGYDLSGFMVLFTGGGSHLLPVTGVNSSLQSYGFWSIEHLTDLLNLHLLLAPFALVLFAAWPLLRLPVRPEGRAAVRFAIVLGACALLFTSAINAELGMSRDWDLFAPLMLGILLPSLLLVNVLAIDARLRQAILLMMTAVTLLHTAGWVGVNADKDASLRRIGILEDRRYWGVHAIADANEELGIYYRELGEIGESIRAFRKAVAADPSHGRLWSILANAYTLNKQTASAISCYQQAIRADSSRWKDHVTLGALLSSVGRYDDAIAVTRRAIALQPDSAVAYDNLGGFLCTAKRAYSEALPFFLRATELNPFDPQALYDTGLCYDALGEQGKSLLYFGKFLALEPSGRRAEEVRAMIGRAGR